MLHAPLPGPPAPSAGSPFATLGLSPALLAAVQAEGYAAPTPIQARAIPEVLAGRDVLGCAETGTGKTAAFVLPILDRLAARGERRRLRALVLTPTRELAAQIAERARAYGRRLGLGIAVVYGGVGQHHQEAALGRRPELLVATPGRLLDLMSQGLVRLDAVECFVLDEADRMLDLGFVDDVRRVVAALPRRRQTLFFSATLPPDVGELAAGLLSEPVRVSVSPPTRAAPRAHQQVRLVRHDDKPRALLDLLREPGVERTIVFTRTKHGADRVARRLGAEGIEAMALHGNKTQGARERALLAFRTGRAPVLVATDIAARGIDVEGVTHVVNFDVPNVPETYIHRIGRTARAGNAGTAVSLCAPEERGFLNAIERHLGRVLEGSGNDAVPFRGPARRPAATGVEADVPRRPAAGHGRRWHRRHGNGARQTVGGAGTGHRRVPEVTARDGAAGAPERARHDRPAPSKPSRPAAAAAPHPGRHEERHAVRQEPGYYPSRRRSRRR